MNELERKIESLSRLRVRAGLWILAGFVVVLAAIAANDALVREGRAVSPARQLTFALMAGGALVLLVNLTRFALITRRSLLEPALRARLWDELATSNHVYSMVIAFGAMLLVLIGLAVVSMFTTLSAPWILNGLLVTAFGVQAGSFALLERRGDNARD